MEARKSIALAILLIMVLGAPSNCAQKSEKSRQLYEELTDSGYRLGEVYGELANGQLDGKLVDISGWTDVQALSVPFENGAIYLTPSTRVLLSVAADPPDPRWHRMDSGAFLQFIGRDGEQLFELSRTQIRRRYGYPQYAGIYTLMYVLRRFRQGSWEFIEVVFWFESSERDSPIGMIHARLRTGDDAKSFLDYWGIEEESVPILQQGG